MRSVETFVSCLGSTALTHAAGYGYEEIVELLLNSTDIDVNLQTNSGKN